MAKRTTPDLSQNEKDYSLEISKTDDGKGLPTVEVSPPFLLFFHPNRWMVMQGEVVPSLTKCPLTRGVNRVMFGADNKPVIHQLKALMESKGFLLVRPDWAPKGRPSYIKSVQTKTEFGEKTTYVSVFERTFSGGSKTSLDEKAYVAWLKELMDSGKIPGPSQFRLEQLSEQVQTRLKSAEDRQQQGTASSERVDQLRAEYGAVQKRLSEFEAVEVEGEDFAFDMGAEQEQEDAPIEPTPATKKRK